MNPIDDLTKRRQFFRRRFFLMLSFSLVIHLIFLLGILVSSKLQLRKRLPRKAYQVSLVSLPLGVRKNLPQPPAAQKSPAVTPPKKEKEKPKKSIPKPKKNDEPKPVPPAETDVLTAQKNMEDQEKSENFSMGISGDGTQRSGSMSIDAAHFPFLYYLQIVRDKIARNWIPPFGVVVPGESKTLMIYFKIAQNGTLFETEIEESSGNSLLDQSATRAVLVSNPFPPLPFGFTDQELGIHFRFECFR
ncbi:energy transducer TonB [candidate division CSSED10-310 bacterium]|uniref:Energy transducer TonB n=1 Tax=candidate division CSSED10-310 bacterium TaxID=2855610 RepID=A0ABV6YUU7_UNCC1